MKCIVSPLIFASCWNPLQVLQCYRSPDGDRTSWQNNIELQAAALMILISSTAVCVFFNSAIAYFIPLCPGLSLIIYHALGMFPLNMMLALSFLPYLRNVSQSVAHTKGLCWEQCPRHSLPLFWETEKLAIGYLKYRSDLTMSNIN